MVFKYIILLCFVNYAFCDEVRKVKEKDDSVLLSSIEEKMESKVGEYAGYFTEKLEAFNDKHLINSELGRILHYEDIKPKAKASGNEVEGRGKKLAALIPLIFHIGVATAWMLMTTILTAKSVAIGLTLLVLKIAVGSAKVASYFTAWKTKNHQHHGHSLHEHPWIPHHDHHGHKRSLTEIDHHAAHEWPTYTAADWGHHDYSAPEYKVSSPYQTQAFGEYEYTLDPKKALEKKYG